jgi:benzoyl-CoA reductase/2-hydroxyglutaryl-CoA dehydratase subunit BcrC/BadD/HgdB
VNKNSDAKYFPMLPSEEKAELQKAFKISAQNSVKENIDKMRKVPNRARAMEYFDQISDFYGQREKEIREFKAKGGHVIGYGCMMAPVELILAAGAIPIRIDSGFYTPSKIGDRVVPVEVCPVVRSMVGLTMAELHPFFNLCDVVISPNTCDGKTKVFEILSDAFPIWEMNVPRTKDTPQARAYWLEQIKEVKEKLEKLTGKIVNKNTMRSAIATTLKATEASRRLQDIRKNSPSVITGRDAMLVEQMTFFDDISRWTEKTNLLCDELEQKLKENLTVAPQDTPRILLTGSPMIWPDCWKIPNLIEEAKPAGLIVADELCSGDRVFFDPVGVDEGSKDDLLKAIAERYILPCTCPCFTSEKGNQDRIDKLQTLVKDYKISGVIYHVIRGCHLYAMEYMRLKRLFDKENIPIYYLDTEYSREDSGQMKTRIEAFIEMLATKNETEDLYA